MTLDPSELRVESWPRQGSLVVGVSNGVRVMHVPSGTAVTVTEHRRQSDNRREALRRLEKLLG